MRAKLTYKRGFILATKIFKGESIMFITNDDIKDIRLYVNDKFIISISPNVFISFEYINL